jgi:hypothetical protein
MVNEHGVPLDVGNVVLLLVEAVRASSVERPPTGAIVILADRLALIHRVLRLGVWVEHGRVGAVPEKDVITPVQPRMQGSRRCIAFRGLHANSMGRR